MSFDASQQQINFLLGKKIYSIPRNQRKYVWDIDNWKNLLEDLDFLKGSTKNHFLGSIVLNTLPNLNNDDLEYYEIIDGQQRITTIVLILIVIAQIFRERKEEALFQGLLPYIQTTNINNKTSCILYTDGHSCVMNLVNTVANKSVQNTFQSLITNCITNKNKDSKIEKCLKFYYENLSYRSTEEVVIFRNALISANYVNIKATKEDAYTVFEILNARGIDLEDYELLKNYILRYTVPENNVDVARQEWKEEIENRLGKNINNFLKHYIAHKYGVAGVTKPRAVYDEIKKRTSIGDVNSLFSDLKLKAKYYQRIVCEGNMEEGQNTDIDIVLRFMQSNRSLLFRPIYLSLLHQAELGNISEEMLTKVFKCIQFFFVCYNLISQETSNKISEGIQKYASLIENKFSLENLNRFLTHLKDRMPNKEEFKDSFKLMGYSNHCKYYHDKRNKQRVEVALNLLEQIRSGRTDIPSFTIEHILPDSQDRQNASIGNLMPLEENLNGSCQDKQLSEKILIYKRSSFVSARNVADRYGTDINKFKIESRSEAMAEELYNNITKMLTSI